MLKYMFQQSLWRSFLSDSQCFVYTPVSYTYPIKEQLVNSGSRKKIVYSSKFKNRAEGDCEEKKGAGLVVSYDFLCT